MSEAEHKEDVARAIRRNEVRQAVLKRIAEQPLTEEFAAEQAARMHDFMRGWRWYDALVRIAREALKDEGDDDADGTDHGQPRGG